MHFLNSAGIEDRCHLQGLQDFSEIKLFSFPQPIWLWWYQNIYRKTLRS